MNNIAYFITAASIVGTVANSLQKRWCFWVWICTNTFWCAFNTVNGQYAQSLLYAFNFAMAVLGLVKWKKKQKSKSNDVIVAVVPSFLDETAVQKAEHIFSEAYDNGGLILDSRTEALYVYNKRKHKTEKIFDKSGVQK